MSQSLSSPSVVLPLSAKATTYQVYQPYLETEEPVAQAEPPPPSTYLPAPEGVGAPGTQSWHRLFTISGEDAKNTDIFHILEGSATFVTGGKVVQPRTVSPGETRGKEISGGDTRYLTKGDIIVIPIGVPHWFKEVHPPLLYFVVKVRN